MDVILIINSLSHLTVDALSAAVLFGPVAAAGDLAEALLLYNTLAFSTQCVVGILTDRMRRHELLVVASLTAVALGFLLPLHWLTRVIVIGLGNSVFHVAGGTITLRRSNCQAGPLGVFVAPGAVGLCIGTLYPASGTYFSVIAFFAAGIFFLTARSMKSYPGLEGCVRKNVDIQWLAVAALLAAVAVRAVGGTVSTFAWKTTPALTLLMVSFVFAGKTAGGFICDRLGVKNTAFLSLPFAAVLIALCSAWMLPSLAGQFFLNLSMPVTLWLIYRAIPDSPGLAFGLAASALWPGTIAGGFLKLAGPALWCCVLACFIFGLAAIIYSERKTADLYESVTNKEGE